MLILKLLFRIEYRGRENLPKKGGFILASNHVSYLDPVAVGVACPRRLNYMARHDLFSIPFFSWLIRRVGAFPVKRDSADLSAIKEAIRIVKGGQGLLLFPQGGRQINIFSNQAEPGIGFLAAKLDAPVIPAYVKGTDKAWPKGAKFPRFHKISVSFGKEITVERRMPYQDIARSIMDDIRHLS